MSTFCGSFLSLKHLLVHSSWWDPRHGCCCLFFWRKKFHRLLCFGRANVSKNTKSIFFYSLFCNTKFVFFEANVIYAYFYMMYTIMNNAISLSVKKLWYVRKKRFFLYNILLICVKTLIDYDKCVSFSRRVEHKYMPGILNHIYF